MSVGTAEELFVDELKDIYSAEKQAVKAFPKLAKAVQSEELRQAMQDHLEQTKGQVERLDRIFEILEERAGGKTCAGMKGLVEEAQSQLEEIEKGPVLDCAMIGALQRIEHYEIAAYGTLVAWARVLGHDEAAELLQQTLDEEKAADEKLSALAEGGINDEAAGGGDDDEMVEEPSLRSKSTKNTAASRRASAAPGRARARS